MEKKLKKIEPKIEKLQEEFPEVGEEGLESLAEIISGDAVGKDICHTWSEPDGHWVVYNGRIDKFKSKQIKYVISYWTQDQEYDDAEEYDVTVYELAAILSDGVVIVIFKKKMNKL